MRVVILYVFVFLFVVSCTEPDKQSKTYFNNELNLSIMGYSNMIDNVIQLNLDKKEINDYLKKFQKAKDSFILSLGQDCNSEKKKLEELIFLITSDTHDSEIIRNIDIEKHCFTTESNKSSIVKRHTILRNLYAHIVKYLYSYKLIF